MTKDEILNLLQTEYLNGNISVNDIKVIIKESWYCLQ